MPGPLHSSLDHDEVCCAAYELKGTGRDGHEKLFRKPWIMTAVSHRHFTLPEVMALTIMAAFEVSVCLSSKAAGRSSYDSARHTQSRVLAKGTTSARMGPDKAGQGNSSPSLYQVHAGWTLGYPANRAHAGLAPLWGRAWLQSPRWSRGASW